MSEKGRFISRMLVVWLFAMVFMPLCARSFTVVIDAGHGGKDPGARGARINEKAINLAVALKLGAFIEERSKDVKVVYTRKTDRFVELDERADIASKTFCKRHVYRTASAALIDVSDHAVVGTDR